MSRTAAQPPMAAALGIRPMRNDATPITNIVTISIFLRPIRSPKCPNRMPPSGRARYPAAKVPKENSTEVSGSSPAKKTVGKTMAAAVP